MMKDGIIWSAYFYFIAITVFRNCSGNFTLVFSLNSYRDEAIFSILSEMDLGCGLESRDYKKNFLEI